MCITKRVGRYEIIQHHKLILAPISHSRASNSNEAILLIVLTDLSFIYIQQVIFLFLCVDEIILPMIIIMAREVI